jgi:hypothetical protein
MANLDWNKPVCTQHDTPLVGEVSGKRGTENRRAVALPSLSQKEAEKWPTTWYYPEDGIGRFDRQPDPLDLVNFDPNDGVYRRYVDRGTR